MERRILKGTTPTLLGYPRLRPDVLLQSTAIGGAGAKVSTPTKTAPAFDDQAVNVDDVVSAVSAAGAVGDETLAVAAMDAGLRRYLLQVGAEGRLVEIESKTRGADVTTLRLGSPLPLAVPAATSFVLGFALERTLTEAETAQVGEGSVLWQCTVDGELVQWGDTFRIVSRIPKATLTPSSLVRLRPIMKSLQLPDDVTFEDVIAGAFEGRIDPLFEKHSVYFEDVVSDGAVEPLHALACVLHVVEDDPRQPRDFVEDLRKQFITLTASTFERRSYAEQSQDADLRPRNPHVVEDRARGIRWGR